MAALGVSGARTKDGLARRLRHLPTALGATGVLLMLAAAVGWGLRGATGASGAAAGVVLVAVSYVISSVVVAWADSVNPRLVMPVGLTTYVVKFMLIGLVMAAVADARWAGLPAMGVGIIVAALVWTAAQAWWVWRTRIPYVDLGDE